MKKKIKLAAIHSDYTSYQGSVPDFIEANIEKAIAFMHEAGRCGADLVCTHEDFTGAGYFIRDLERPGIFPSLAEQIPGPLTGRLGKVAEQYGMYIAANSFEKGEDGIYNTTVLIGRDGKIVGKYRKVHPADGERWLVRGGTEFPVFDTDIGRIGFVICYDIIFPENSRALTMNGANIIIHQTQGWGIGGRTRRETGEAMMRTRAAENSVYLVVAKNIQPGDGGKSLILDTAGGIIAEAPGSEEKVLAAEFEPDFDMIDEYDFDNFYAGITSTKARQLLARVPSAYRVLTEEDPPVLNGYAGIKLCNSAEGGMEILKKWEGTDERERSKYHW